MGVFPIIGISKLERIVNATIQCIKQADKSKTRDLVCVKAGSHVPHKHKRKKK